MKKELIGLSVCVLMVAVAFATTIKADERSETAYLSEQDLTELKNKLLEFNNLLLTVDTWEEKEPIFRDLISLFDEYGVLPDDTNVDQEVELMKTCYIEQNNVQNEIAQGELTMESTLIMNQPQQLLSPTGWYFLSPCLNRFPIGFEIIGEAWGGESFNSLSITKTRRSGFTYFFFGGNPIKIKNSNLVLEYWYIVYGMGQFDVSCTWTWNGDTEETGGRFEVRGLRVSLVIT